MGIKKLNDDDDDVVQFAARRTPAGGVTDDPRGVADRWPRQASSTGGGLHPRTTTQIPEHDANARRLRRGAERGWMDDFQKQFEADPPRQTGRLLFDADWRVIADTEE